MANNRVNPTHAKDIALYFYDKKGWRVGSASASSPFGRTVVQAKALLGQGFSKEEVISAIDYAFEHADVDIFSLGYINYHINNILDKIKKEAAKAYITKENVQPIIPNIDTESTKRNLEKIAKKKNAMNKNYDFSMFESEED